MRRTTLATTSRRQHNVAWAEVYFRTEWRLHLSSPLATIDMGRKLGGGCAFFSGGSGSPSNTKSPGPRPYLYTKWHLNPSSHLATTDTGRKLGAVSFGGRRAGPHLTQCGHDRGLPVCQVSNRLATIHQRHRQDRQTLKTDWPTVR